MSVASCASLAALTRTVGATLVLAVILLLLVERRWRPAAAYAAIVLVFILGAALWLRARAMPELAADYLTDALDPGAIASGNPVTVLSGRVVRNAADYAGALLGLLSFPTIAGTLVDNVTWLVIACVALTVGVGALWRRWRIALLFGLTYGSLMLAWPWAIGRFLVPVLPVVVVAVLAGLDALAMRRNRRTAVALVVAIAAVMTITGVARGAAKVAVRRQCDRERAMQSPSCFNADQLSLFAAARYAAANTPPSALFISANEATFHYLSERRLVSIDSINARPPGEAADFLERNRISYVVLNHVSFDALDLARTAVHHVRPSRACTRVPPSHDHLPPSSDPDCGRPGVRDSPCVFPSRRAVRAADLLRSCHPGETPGGVANGHHRVFLPRRRSSP